MHDILPLVERPSRYLGTEINRIKKAPENVKLRFALAFPDLYEIGTSHFGIQILYHILNSMPDVAAERVYSPAADMEAAMRTGGVPMASLESQTPLKDFHIIGFSLLYELNYTNVLTLLDLAGIPYYSAQRSAEHPVIIAGGPCNCNPEPVADFFDAMVIGEAEDVIVEMADAWIRWNESGDGNRNSLLDAWSDIRGVYIPSFFKPEYVSRCGETIQTLIPLKPGYTEIERAVVDNLNDAAFPDKPIIPHGKPVHDRLRLEVARGCTRGCRFCQAGMIYRPVRERSAEKLLQLVEACLRSTGYEDLSLLSLSTGDYERITDLMQRLMIRCEADRVAVSLPSLRAGTLPPDLMELIKKVRKTGFTIAPEAASQRLRDVINKNISHADIIDTVQNAFSMGWQVIKLYFMIGLPTETDADLDQLVDIAKELHNLKPAKGRRGKINISVGTFIPKPHTPFQWAGQMSVSETKDKQAFLRDRLNMGRIRMKWQKPETSFLEGLLARGDRRLSGLLVTAYNKGCRFDGWTDQFRYDLWQEAFHDEGIDAQSDVTRERSLDAPLPWDHINIGASRSFLAEEWQRALKCKTTMDCRHGECQSCGACDFERIQPRLSPPLDPNGDHQASTPALGKCHDNETGVKLQLTYTKTGDARYFGHLELSSVIIRAIRRAGIPVMYSRGFHPMPKVSFSDPLPLGMESENEICFMTVRPGVNPSEVKDKLNRELPDGISITLCGMRPSRKLKSNAILDTYKIIRTDGGRFDQEKQDLFRDAPEFHFPRTNKKGKLKHIDLKPLIPSIQNPEPGELELIIRKEQGGITVRPRDVLEHVFHMTVEEMNTSRYIKLGSETLYEHTK